jgi:lipopolysaccharide/colanic/teichoic acid biosynthesis glycosyltransferase
MSARPAAEDVPYRLPKRLMDKTVSVALLVLLSPLLATVLLAMALDMLFVPADRGGFLYRERRISHGREFDLLKLRTLRAPALAAMRDASGYARTYEADEANLTWAGRRVLKRWYLDELPQLVNILRGDMSLVGPRPWPLSMVADQVTEGYDYRNHIKAGWTGPDQVRKGRAEVVDSTVLDLDYAQRCRRSGALDLVRYDAGILAETVRVLARGEGLAY